jgi:hypothetical protein
MPKGAVVARKFKDMTTPEQQWAAQQAPRLHQLAHQADQQAQRHQMGADVYGRPDKDYTDTKRAAREQRQADNLRDRSAKLRQQADQAKKAVAPKPQKKRTWF